MTLVASRWFWQKVGDLLLFEQGYLTSLWSKGVYMRISESKFRIWFCFDSLKFLFDCALFTCALLNDVPVIFSLNSKLIQDSSSSSEKSSNHSFNHVTIEAANCSLGVVRTLESNRRSSIIMKSHIRHTPGVFEKTSFIESKSWKRFIPFCHNEKRTTFLCSYNSRKINLSRILKNLDHENWNGTLNTVQGRR